MPDQSESNTYFQWKPEIPTTFYKTNAVHSSLMAVTSLFLYIAPLIAAYYLLQLPINLFFKSVIIILMGFLMAIGNVLLAIFIHEAAHYTLYNNRLLNQIIGIICLSVTPSAFLSCTRFFELHAKHHKYFHSINDPEEIFFPYTNKKLNWYILFLGMKNTIRYLLVYSKQSMQHLFTYFVNKKIINDENEIKHKNKLFMFECIFYFTCLCLQLYFILLSPILLLVFLIANFLALATIAAVGHASHAFIFIIPKQNQKIKPWISRLVIKLSFGTYLHLEHHAYPTVPAYQLPQLSRFLFAEGFYSRNKISLTPIHFQIVSDLN